MQIPGPAALSFLAYLLVFLPWMAFRSAGRLRVLQEKGGGAAAGLTRRTIWVSTLFGQGLLLLLTALVGWKIGFRFFARPPLRPADLLLAAAVLLAHFGLRAVRRAVISEEARRKMMIFKLAPRDGREWTLYVATVLVASVTEEAAYRGVGMSVLWNALGSPWAAALVCATAFALAHWMQGWRSGLVIFAMALLMHGLVQYTATLALAMLVHALYDLAAGYIISRDAVRFDREAAAISAAGAPGR